MLKRSAVAVALVGALLGGVWVWFKPDPIFTPVASQPAQLLSELTWHQDGDWFGGFSGLEVAADGVSFVAINDRGYIVSGELRRDGDAIVGVSLTDTSVLRDANGIPVVMPRNDAEGLAIGVDGQINVSFELVHRVWSYKAPRETAEWASYINSWRAMANNGGMEALAIDSDGTLWTVSEATGKHASSTLVYTRRRGEKWQQPYVLPVSKRFLPVGADFGPDGRLYLLERDVYPFGFRSRIRALTLSENGIVAIEILMETPLGMHGNLEGISVWSDVTNRTRFTLIADDNFLPVQRTEIVEYVLP